MYPRPTSSSFGKPCHYRVVLVRAFEEERLSEFELRDKGVFGRFFAVVVDDDAPLVHPGQTVTTLYNNLIRAPLFKHHVPETDFLVVR
jgi:hypothetical protein